VKFIPSHVPFISKSNSENCIKISWFLTKLRTKISWLLSSWPTVYIFRISYPVTEFLQGAKFTLCPSLAFSYIGSVTTRHSSSGLQPNFAALSRGRHLHSAARPSRWASAHILVLSFFLAYSQPSHIGSLPYFHTWCGLSANLEMSEMCCTWLAENTGGKNYASRMWANAQRDGRPAEYRWRRLFNAAKFGWRPLLECRAVTLQRRETRWNLPGCPKVPNWSQPLVGRSSPYCEDMWGRYRCLTSFSDCRYMPELRRYSPTKLCDDYCDGAQMANFWRFFGPAFPASHVQHISDMHSKFAVHTKATSCVEVW